MRGWWWLGRGRGCLLGGSGFLGGPCLWWWWLWWRAESEVVAEGGGAIRSAEYF